VKVLAVLLILCLAGVAAGEPNTRDIAGGLLADAQAHFADADYAGAAALAGRVAAVGPDVPAVYRAEAARVRGLSLFFTGDRPGAEAALLDYLRLVPDAHLDPALVAPEAIVFFEEVRTRHAGELLVLKPRPEKKRYWVLNLLPPFGQFQNGDRVRGWIFGGAELAFLATNVTTFVLLRSSCSTSDLTCDRDPSTNRALQVVNIASGIAFAVAYAVGVVDGFVGYHRAEERDKWQVGIGPTFVYLSHHF
jgi:hypothetical protein